MSNTLIVLVGYMMVRTMGHDVSFDLFSKWTILYVLAAIVDLIRLRVWAFKQER